MSTKITLYYYVKFLSNINGYIKSKLELILGVKKGKNSTKNLKTSDFNVFNQYIKNI